MEIIAGSSKTEPGVTPQNNITLTYNAWSEIQHACGESRLHGGMHFSKAVPAGEELCTGLASHVVNSGEKLKIGDADGALADLNDTSITVKKSANSPCLDSASWAYETGSGGSKGCAFVAKGNSARRCRKVPGAAENCPKTCNVCGN